MIFLLTFSYIVKSIGHFAPKEMSQLKGGNYLIPHFLLGRHSRFSYFTLDVIKLDSLF